VKTLKYLLAGASLSVGLSTIVSTSAQAATITMDANSIQLNSSNYQTYTGGSNGNFVADNLNAARTALTDSDTTSNVELWYTSEKPSANVGFTGTIGGHQVSVSSVTKSDWSVFGNTWLNGLLAANAEINALWSGLSSSAQMGLRTALTTNGLPAAGDPNVGALALDTNTNMLSLNLIGHMDLKPRILAGQYSFGNSVVDLFMKQAASTIKGGIQASEVAKVVIDGKTHYAYGFNATSTGITTPDGTESYTGQFTWSEKLSGDAEAVPEPSTMLGVAVAGGVVALRRKMKRA
jgi:hypothetical protein